MIDVMLIYMNKSPTLMLVNARSLFSHELGIDNVARLFDIRVI